MQATYNAQPRQYCGPNVLLILILIAVGTMSILSIQLSQHANVSHPNGATAVRDCLSKNGPLQIWVNPETGRQARVCQIAPKTFGLQIVEENEGGWREITSFLKSKLTRLEQVERYLRNAGYVPAGE